MRWGVQEAGRGKWGLTVLNAMPRRLAFIVAMPGSQERSNSQQISMVRIWWLHKMVQRKKPAPRNLLGATAQLCTDDRVNLRDGRGHGRDWDQPDFTQMDAPPPRRTGLPSANFMKSDLTRAHDSAAGMSSRHYLNPGII